MADARIEPPGARESNAGDEFHILWAVQRLLSLLQPSTPLARLVLEGVSPVDDAAKAPALLQGVDLTEYYGGETFGSAERILVTQLKYSQRKPGQPWTPARLARNGSRGQPGVVARLAEAYSAFREGRDRADVLERLRLRLVSNQPAHPKLASLMRAINDRLGAYTQPVGLASILCDLPAVQKRDLERLHKATDLSEADFTDFLGLLDFTELGTSERWEQEAKIVLTLSEHILEDPVGGARELFDLVRKQTLPEARDSLGLDRADVLARLSVGGWSSLFPMPAKFSLAERPIETPDAKKLADVLLNSDRKIVVAHGDAGVGKTTTVIQLEEAMPEGSVVILYDCFGAGDYLNADETRHLVEPALTQIINELALRCGTPLLMRGPKIEALLWRHLKTVLEQARRSLRDGDARVVLAIDAADNAIIAGRARSQPTFIPDFASLKPPDGVSLLMTCRTHRLEDLQAPDHARYLELTGFDKPASACHLRSRFPTANDKTCICFHENSAGNPRSQFYVLNAVGNASDAANEAKGTPQIMFDEIVGDAIEHVADPDAARRHLANLVCLTRPIDLDVFASASGLSVDAARTFCRGLVPGVRLESSTVAFRDEDFETHLRGRVSHDDMRLAHRRLAEHFMAKRDIYPWAAIAVAEHLRLAGQDEQLITLAIEEEQPRAIDDPVARLQAYFRRLELALQVAERAESRANVVRLILLAARAARTDQAVAAMVRSRPDLAMRHGDRDAVARIYEAGHAEPWRGPLHLRVAGLFARLGEHEEAAEHMRLAEAWIRRWMDLGSDARFNWRLTTEDVAAGAQAVYWMMGAEATRGWLARWRPVEFVLEAAEKLVVDVAQAKGVGDTCDELSGLDLPAVVEARLLAALSVAGHRACQRTVQRVVNALVVDQPARELRRANWTVDFLELAAHVTRDQDQVIALSDQYGPVLPEFAPAESQEMGDWHAPLRCHCLKAACLDKEIDREDLLPDSLKATAPTPQKYEEQQRQENQRRRIEGMLDRHLPILQVRAHALLGRSAVQEIEPVIRERLDTYAESSRNRWHKHDRSFQPWAQSAAEALVAAAGAAADLLADIADIAPAATLTSGVDVWISLGTLLLRVPQYQDLAMGLLDRAVSTTEASEEPAGERADRVMHVAGLVDPQDAELGGDYYRRAIVAAAGLDDDGVGVLRVNARLASMCAASGSAEAPQLAERLARSVERYTPFVSDVGILPWTETIDGVAGLSPAAGLALVSRWEDEDRLSLHHSIGSALIPLAAQGFVKPDTAITLLRLSGENQFPVSAALQLLELLQAEGAASRTRLGRALRELSLFVRRDLLPGARLRAAPIIAAWMREQRLHTLPGGKELLELADFAEQLETNTPAASGLATFTDPDSRLDRAAEIVSGAHRDEVDAVRERLEALAGLYAGESQIIEYLVRFGAALPPAKRVAALDALADIRADDPLWRFHGEALLTAISTWIAQWKNGQAVSNWITERLTPLLRDRFTSFVAYEQTAATTLPIIMGLPTRGDPATLLIELVGPSLGRLNAGQLYAVASALATSLVSDEQVDVLDWSLNKLAEDVAPPAPDLPTDEPRAVTLFLWALFGHPDTRVRWRAAHVARSLLCAADPLMGDCFVNLLDKRDGNLFVDGDHEFLWMSAQVCLLTVLSRVAHEAPATLNRHVRRLAEFALNPTWPHAASRELAKRAALYLAQHGGGTLGDELRTTLEATGRPVACMVKRGHHWSLDDGRHDDTDRRFRFDTMDTMPYWYITGNGK